MGKQDFADSACQLSKFILRQILRQSLAGYQKFSSEEVCRSPHGGCICGIAANIHRMLYPDSGSLNHFLQLLRHHGNIQPDIIDSVLCTVN